MRSRAGSLSGVRRAASSRHLRVWGQGDWAAVVGRLERPGHNLPACISCRQSGRRTGLPRLSSRVAFLPTASSEQVSRLNRVCCEGRWFGQSPERSFVDSGEVCTDQSPARQHRQPSELQSRARRQVIASRLTTGRPCFADIHRRTQFRRSMARCKVVARLLDRFGTRGRRQAE